MIGIPIGYGQSVAQSEPKKAHHSRCLACNTVIHLREIASQLLANPIVILILIKRYKALELRDIWDRIPQTIEKCFGFSFDSTIASMSDCY